MVFVFSAWILPRAALPNPCAFKGSGQQLQRPGVRSVWGGEGGFVPSMTITAIDKLGGAYSRTVDGHHNHEKTGHSQFHISLPNARSEFPTMDACML